jgi:hypothetical protein
LTSTSPLPVSGQQTVNPAKAKMPATSAQFKQQAPMQAANPARLCAQPGEPGGERIVTKQPVSNPCSSGSNYCVLACQNFY